MVHQLDGVLITDYSNKHKTKYILMISKDDNSIYGIINGFASRKAAMKSLHNRANQFTKFLHHEVLDASGKLLAYSHKGKVVTL